MSSGRRASCKGALEYFGSFRDFGWRTKIFGVDRKYVGIPPKGYSLRRRRGYFALGRVRAHQVCGGRRLLILPVIPSGPAALLTSFPRCPPSIRVFASPYIYMQVFVMHRRVHPLFLLMDSFMCVYLCIT